LGSGNEDEGAAGAPAAKARRAFFLSPAASLPLPLSLSMTRLARPDRACTCTWACGSA